ncbi:hypothetical protein Pmar_PMAR006236 [Perkinsus marinus ATCC 50983]|uniref:Uncharacterized protein n=1 Tax=Perkinsus marinus (strain ATCC 50983 / TXsc) TaxID=423536 RepID=C5LAG9_PERM5|nr:hypothetical protein Pmar_PMAR006236 [Perkinsus marinus ATCC 50983]EER06425.1 hypothetical protein Pmar_PMAR006236 [Perkinsus marinus ATCC 50983]|eukprot:XP_002774609.1 hypothetical protein Pmar_PMAR006236 [Perkinsus marinus ATCC 50983]
MDPHAQREKVSPYALQGTLGHVIGETSATGINPGSTTPTNAPSGVRSLLLRQDEWTSGVMFDGDTGISRMD